MIPSFETNTFAVFDDFLSVETLESVRSHMADEHFSYLKSFWKRSNYFRIFEGEPLVGPTIYHGHPQVSEDFPCYPSGNPTDLVVEALLDAEESLGKWIGLRGNTWDFFTCTSYQYPAGSSVSWHDDAKDISGLDKAGSFILYLHDEWKSSWGGELLVAADVGDRIASVERYRGVNTDIGQYIAAVPNRLVVLKAGTPHSVKSVSARAGENLRLSMTGFFQPLPQTRQL